MAIQYLLSVGRSLRSFSVTSTLAMSAGEPPAFSIMRRTLSNAWRTWSSRLSGSLPVAGSSPPTAAENTMLPILIAAGNGWPWCSGMPGPWSRMRFAMCSSSFRMPTARAADARD